mmetsp:Transcript_19259/g.72745  ORF Transcript_19259/g.72745 Transcript_19259/m.72745 type:complete len:261 (+) Transcript_19259:1362-2144(+)
MLLPLLDVVRGPIQAAVRRPGRVGEALLFGVAVQHGAVLGGEQALEVAGVGHLVADLARVPREEQERASPDVVDGHRFPRVSGLVAPAARDDQVPEHHEEPHGRPLDVAHVDDLGEVLAEAQGEVIAVVEVLRQAILGICRELFVGVEELPPLDKLLADGVEAQDLERPLAVFQDPPSLPRKRRQVLCGAEVVTQLLHFHFILHHPVQRPPFVDGMLAGLAEEQHMQQEGDHDEGQAVVDDLQHVVQQLSIVLIFSEHAR